MSVAAYSQSRIQQLITRAQREEMLRRADTGPQAVITTAGTQGQSGPTIPATQEAIITDFQNIPFWKRIPLFPHEYRLIYQNANQLGKLVLVVRVFNALAQVCYL